MGNLAVKAYQYMVLQAWQKSLGIGRHMIIPGRRKLKWDGENMKITNYDKANEWVTREYRKGWELS